MSKRLALVVLHVLAVLGGVLGAMALYHAAS